MINILFLNSIAARLHREVRPGPRLPLHRSLHRGEGEVAAPGIICLLFSQYVYCLFLDIIQC